MFTVQGGVFTDTTFTELESEPENYGPFPSYAEAYSTWKAQTGWKVDICCHRLFIKAS